MLGLVVVATPTSVAPAASNLDGIGKVYISTPYPYVTSFSYTDVGRTGTVSPTASIISAASVPSRTGTLVSILPDVYKTKTGPYTGCDILTTPITSVTAPASGPTVGTVGITTQPPVVTSVIGYDQGPGGTDVRTSTSTGVNVAPTVYISTPYPYITITLGNDATTTWAGEVTTAS